MKKEKTKDIAKIFAEGTLIDKALKAGVQDALRRHKQAGQPVVEWRNGQVVWIPAEKIKVDAVRNGRKNKPKPA